MGRKSSYGLPFPIKTKRFSFFTASRTALAFYQRGAGGFSPEIKRPGNEADKSSPPSAEVNNVWIYAFTPP
jgi:hypothetical protein